jgi:hypothetical protein
VCDGPGLPVRGRDRGPSEEPQEQQPPRTANGVAQIGKHVLCSGFASERAGQVGESGRFAMLFRRRPGSALAEGLGPATETKRRAFVLCITPVLLTLDSVGHQMACAEQPRFASASRAAFCSGTRCRLGGALRRRAKARVQRWAGERLAQTRQCCHQSVAAAFPCRKAWTRRSQDRLAQEKTADQQGWMIPYAEIHELIDLGISAARFNFGRGSAAYTVRNGQLQNVGSPRAFLFLCLAMTAVFAPSSPSPISTSESYPLVASICRVPGRRSTTWYVKINNLEVTELLELSGRQAAMKPAYLMTITSPIPTPWVFCSVVDMPAGHPLCVPPGACPPSTEEIIKMNNK